METIDILGAIGALSLVITALVDAIRRHFAVLDGSAVQLVAFALAYLACWALDFTATAELVELLKLPAGRVPPLAVDYAVTAVAIMAGAGKLAELTKRRAPVVVEVNPDGSRR